MRLIVLPLVLPLLLIAAMAQPVIEKPLEGGGERLRIVMAVQTGAASDEEARKLRELAQETIRNVAGNEIALLAFDEKLHWISPLSRDHAILSLLAGALPRTGGRAEISQTVAALERIDRADLAVLVTAEPAGRGGKIAVVSDREGIDALSGWVEAKIRERRMANHIPLFYYPLGLAMALILFALSSMSRRRSVEVAALIAVFWLGTPGNVEAGVFDFRLLNDATVAYERGDYVKSAALFARYQQYHDSPQVRYNRANALYKAGRYAQAAFWYRRVHTDDAVLDQRRRYNLLQAQQQMALQENKEGKGAFAAGEYPKEKSQNGGESGARAGNGFVTPLFRFP